MSSQLDSYRLFFNAIFAGDYDNVVKYIGDNVNTKYFFGSTPLIEAIQGNHFHIVQFLLDSGADIHCKWAFQGNTTPLHIASKLGHKEIVQLLINYGADPNISDDYYYPLAQALNFEHLSVAKILLDAGSDPNVIYGQDVTPLIWACMFGRTNVVKLLLSYGANIYWTDCFGKNSIDYANLNGFYDLANFLTNYSKEMLIYSFDMKGLDNLILTL